MTSIPTFEESTIWLEVQDILNSGSKDVLFDYKGVVHTPKEDIELWDLNALETVRDYLHNIAETRTVMFKIGLGDYVNRIYPYRQNLEFTLTRTTLKEAGSRKADNRPALVIRFKAIFNANENPPVGGSELETQHPEQLNLQDMPEIKLELSPRPVEVLRIKTTGGAFRNIKVEDLIKATIAAESAKFLIDGKPCIDGVDMVPPDNTRPIPNAIIPAGTHITALPTHVQLKMAGVYNRDIGTFFQEYDGKKLWFVYPTYDTLRFDGADKRVIFYAVPQEKLPQLDRSFRVEGKTLRVAVTAQRRYNDTAEVGYMNEGSGYRLADADAYMKKPAVITEQGPRASRAQLNHENVMVERDDGLNYAPMAANPSGNPYAARSAVVARSMGQIDLVWENADPELIYPGMPCQYVYLSAGKVKSLKGTVLFVHAFSSRVEKYNASAYRTNARLTIACEPMSYRPELEQKVYVGENPS